MFFIAKVLEHKTANKYNLLVLHVIGIHLQYEQINIVHVKYSGFTAGTS